MGSAIGVAGKFLFNIGQGIANAVRRRRSEKANAKKMKAVMGLIEGERKNWAEYIKGIDAIYNQLGDKTKREIQSIFRTQTKQLKNAIQQRRIPEYLAGVEKLSKAQSTAISDAMLGVESARLQAKGGTPDIVCSGITACRACTSTTADLSTSGQKYSWSIPSNRI